MWTTSPIFPRSSLNLLEEKYSQGVTWLSPQANDTFHSWDTLIAKWNSQEVLDSPAFRLCTLPDDSLHPPFLPRKNEMEEAYLDDNCGSEVSPTVEKSDGSFLINFTVPDITEDAFSLLQMNDPSGAVLSSPIFKLSHRPSQSNFKLDTEPQGSPSTPTPRRSPPVVGFNILLVVVCVLVTTAPLLWLCHRHRKKVKMYFKRLSVSQTSTPALLSKIDPGDETSVPIPVFMPPRTSRVQPFIPTLLDRASGVHQPLYLGSSRSFRLPNRYLGGSIYPSLPPIFTSSNTFMNEGDTTTMHSALDNTHISRRPAPPGLASTPLRVHLRSSD